MNKNKQNKDDFFSSIESYNFSPIKLSSRQEELCRKLDSLYKMYPLKCKPSNMFRGALFASRPELRNNPDWLAQAANSLRECLYPFYSKEVNIPKKEVVLTEYGAVRADEKLIKEMSIMYNNELNNLAHHSNAKKASGLNSEFFSDADFEILLNKFENILLKVLTIQLDIHKEIDGLIVNYAKRDFQKLKDLIKLNFDANNYFFTKINHTWLSWLHKNGFFEGLKEKSKDPTRYSLKTPELNYLVRIAKNDPEGVVKIMKDIPISSKNFNPEVVGQFLKICGELPAKQLSKMVIKIKNERWPVLMAPFNQWGFEYEKMFRVLRGAGDFTSLLTLAEAILLIRKEKTDDGINKFNANNPFYFTELESAKVFEFLTKIDEKYLKKAFEICTNSLRNIILLGGKTKEGDAFEYKDAFALLDVDFFELDLRGRHISYRDNIRELAAAIKVIAEKLIGGHCSDETKVLRLYRQYIASLPENSSIWRLNLFVMSLCPKVFRDDLKKAFMRLFDSDHYLALKSGAEYEKALRGSFYVLSEGEKSEYVTRVIEFFNRELDDQEKQKWLKRDGDFVFSMIEEHLSKADRERMRRAGFEVHKDHTPKPAMASGTSGFIMPRGLISDEEFNRLSIKEIAERLRSEWAPHKIREMNGRDDFMKPLNAEGVGNQLKEDISKRLDKYLVHSRLFFERDVLDEHYTDVFLSAIEGILRNDDQLKVNLKWDALISMLSDVKDEGEKRAFDWSARNRETFDTWLRDWRSVHSSMAEVIKQLLKSRKAPQRQIDINFTEHREVLLDIIKYLLQNPDPSPEDEKKENDNANYLLSDPFTAAINSVRGKALEAFFQFIYQDGVSGGQENSVGIQADVKKVYEGLLKIENTRAIILMMGHYLPSLYFRDKKWIRSLFDQIFPPDNKKHHFYTASWEGYLTNNLYKNLFEDSKIQALYRRALSENFELHSHQQYFKDPNEGLANHLALAFMHYDEFGFGYPLFDEFWETNPERQAKFVNFIGRSYVSGSNSKFNQLLKENKKSREKLVQLWEWLIENSSDERVFAEFGFWVNLTKGLFQVKWLAKRVRQTLEKTSGHLSWEIGLMDSVVELAQGEPKETVDILRLYFLEGGLRNGKNRIPFQIRDEWYEAFRVLYQGSDKEIKRETYQLIDDLIREGGSAFWKLKEALD